MNDTYAATRRKRGGTFAGEVRDASAAAAIENRALVDYCQHAHRTISAALRCAESMTKEQTA